MKKVLCVFLAVVLITISSLTLIQPPVYASSPYESDWPRVSTILAGIQGIFTSPVNPASGNGYTEGALLGNGELEVAIGGQDTHSMEYYISKNAFWYSGGAANIGKIKISSSTPGSGTNYKVTQNIHEAYVKSDFTISDNLVSAKAWTSDSKNVVVIELTNNGTQSVPVSVALDVNSAGIHTNAVTTAATSNSAIYTTKDTGTMGALGTGDRAWFCKSVMVAKVLGTTATASTNGTNTSTYSFTLTQGQTVKFVTNVESSKETSTVTHPTLRDDAISYMTGVNDTTIATLSTEHTGWYKEFWLKSFIDLSDTNLQKYWYGHLYALSCAYGKHLAATSYLPGIFAFNTRDDMEWGGMVAMNYNMQDPLYGIYSSNHTDIAEPYYNLFTTFSNNVGVPNVQNRVNIHQAILNHMPNPSRGMLFGATTDSYSTNWGNDMGQPWITAYTIVPYVWQWRYTQDSIFLQNTAYPLLLNVANFYEDYLGAKNANGKYDVYGATHETNPDNPNANPQYFQKNDAMDLGAVKWIFKNVIDASVALNTDSSRRTKWQDIYDNISDWSTEPVNGETILMMDPIHTAVVTAPGTGSPCNNSATTMWSTFGEFGLESDSTLRLKVRDTIDAINPWGGAGNDYTNASVGYARTGLADPNTLVQHVKELPLRNNLTVSEWGGAIQTSGIVETIDSMMLQSNQDVLNIFPVWPSDKTGSYKRLRAQGGFLVDASYEFSKVQNVSIYSEAGKTCTVKNPWPGSNLTVKVGATTISTTKNGEKYTFNTTAGNTYVLTTDDGLTIASNLAYGKTATQSSTYSTAAASRAVDGNTNGNYFNNSVTHTNSDAGAWWQVDLNGNYYIDKIKIWNRTDSNMDRLSDYTVSILDANSTVVWSNHQTIYPNTSTLLSVNGVKGKYVKVQLTGTNNLSLAEVQVFGCDNIALGKTTVQSTTAYGGVASRAVDGNTNGNWDNNSVTHTSETENQPWWMVDLGDNYSIDKIKIWNRTDAGMDRLSDYSVYVLDASGNIVWSNHQTSYPNPLTDVYPGGATGRYVKIQLTGANIPLALAEVQVFGVRNVSYNKTATQINTYSSYSASMAVDGNTDGDFSHGSVCHTGGNSAPTSDWWKVDLGGNYNINNIKIWNRIAAGYDRLSDYTLYILDENSNVIWSNLQVNNYPKPAVDLTVRGTTGRYVKIQQTTANIPLNIAEVQVFAD